MRQLHQFGPDLTVASDDESRPTSASRGNRRRLRVFLLVFLPCLLAGMAWNLLRPSEYRAVARVELNLPAAAPGLVAASAPGNDDRADLVSQHQRLQSRPLLEAVQGRLSAAGLAVDPASADPVAALQAMLSVHPVAGSAVVVLMADGDQPKLLAAALNELIAVYGSQLQDAHREGSAQRLANARDELARLEQAVAAQREQLDRFRSQFGVVSGEREENPSAARSRGLANALNTAIEKRSAAEARLQAMQGSNASGAHGGALAKDDPTLANLENRASQLREELTELGKVYTEQYLAMDPKVRGMRTRLAELEDQIAARRVEGRREALASAREELATAQANVAQLQARMTAEQQGLRSFTTRFAQSKAMADDLAAVERARREALERLARMEGTEQAMRPSVEVLQPATPPEKPWRPDHLRDGALVAGGAFALGLLAIGFVELFNRAPATATTTPLTVVVPPAWAPSGALGTADPTQSLAWARTNAGMTALAASAQSSAVPGGAALAEPPEPRAAELRELAQAEVAALLAASTGKTRLACTGWLLGLTTDELIALRPNDVDLDGLVLHVVGPNERRVALPTWFASALPAAARASDVPLLSDMAGHAARADELDVLLSCAAVDAGLPEPTRVTPTSLRHTAMAWQVREGLRLADLPARVGAVDATAVAALAPLAAGVPRRSTQDVPPLMPALRLPPPT